MTHELKIDPVPFRQIVERQKRFEIRMNDRNYQIGDLLHLNETESSADAMRAGAPLTYTGRSIMVAITHLMVGPARGLAADYVILSIEEVPDPQPAATFERELASLLNRYSKENASNTPDWILAAFLVGCLKSWDITTDARTKFYAAADEQL